MIDFEENIKKFVSRKIEIEKILSNNDKLKHNEFVDLSKEL